MNTKSLSFSNEAEEPYKHIINEKSQEVLKKITMEKTLDLSTEYPINTIGRYLKNKFGCKVAKLALVSHERPLFTEKNSIFPKKKENRNTIKK